MHPQNLSTNTLGKSSREQDPDADDQEVTIPRGRGWVPLGQTFQCPALAWPDGGWAPQGPPLQPPTHAQPNADVGHLINTFASGLHLGTPRINTPHQGRPKYHLNNGTTRSSA